MLPQHLSSVVETRTCGPAHQRAASASARLRALARARYRARDEAYRAALFTPWFLCYTLGSAESLWVSLAVLIPVAAVGPAMWVAARFARAIRPQARGAAC